MEFHKSAFSGGGGCVEIAGEFSRSQECPQATCVEVSGTADFIHVRDSKNPTGPVLCFNRKEWSAFIAGIRSGDPNLTLGVESDSGVTD